jgi:hypothetical protein
VDRVDRRLVGREQPCVLAEQVVEVVPVRHGLLEEVLVE